MLYGLRPPLFPSLLCPSESYCARCSHLLHLSCWFIIPRLSIDFCLLTN